MRGRILLAALLGAALTVTPAQAAEAGCTWTETPIPGADTWGTTHVAGGTGTGNYAGSVRRVENDQLVVQLVLWAGTDAPGRTQLPPPGYQQAAAVDQNAAGTVLVRAYALDQTGAAVFRYHDLGGYEALTGFKRVDPVAINDRGDVLLTAFVDNRTEAVVWPGDGTPPVVLDLPADNYVVQATDLDNDGTVLLHLAQGPHLWRAGMLTPLATPPGYRLTAATSLRGGLATGYTRGLDEVATYQALLWADPANPEPIKGAAIADEVNAGGQVIGRDAGFADAVWQRTTFVDHFPQNALPTRVFDDGSMLAERTGGYSVWRGACVGSS
ncbi:hypothetical protein [Amycolatopsis sp. 195334CR]|uniref:hypothetical protein n=1 Tax=Amycolatopsis sp. 195334CR TaxID=2814588 RepID=UPI001A8BFEA4|nr:hypothetical protein [Amycolatopsis sp. 195334CR]MBN6037685.1 hypothetical protein [Amycolatopsis sp. 195334CR]